MYQASRLVTRSSWPVGGVCLDAIGTEMNWDLLVFFPPECIRVVLFLFIPQVKHADVVVMMGAEHVMLRDTCFKPGVTLINCDPALIPGVCSSRTLTLFTRFLTSFTLYTHVLCCSHFFLRLFWACACVKRAFFIVYYQKCSLCCICVLSSWEEAGGWILARCSTHKCSSQDAG